MVKSYKLYIIAAMLMVCVVFSVSGQTAEDVMRSAYIFAPADTAVMEIDMLMEDGSSEKRRTFSLHLDQEGQGARLFLGVTSPPFLRNMKYLHIDSGDGSVQQWLASSAGVERIPPGAGDRRIFDSDFTSGDFFVDTSAGYRMDSRGGEGLTDLPSDISGADVVSVQRFSSAHSSTASAADVSEETVVQRLFVHESSGLILGIDFYAVSGDGREDGTGSGQREIVKRYRVLEISGSGEKPVASLARMEDLNRGSSTALQLRNVELNAVIPRRIFSRGNLQ